jgi:lambda family phage tail tape measure protein
MARNRIEELLVELKFKGGEELKKISGGFRELAKAVNLADGDIEDARTKIIDYGKTLGNTNQAVKGTIQALKALQDSTQRGGEAWTQLSRDVLQFEQAARLTDREIESLRRGIVAEANAHSQSETSIRAHVKALQELRAQSVLGGQVNRQLSQTIGQLTQQLDQAEQASRAHFSALNQALAVRPDAVLRQWQAYTQVLRDVRATAEQAAEAQQRLNQLAGAPRISARRELVARAGIQADPAYQERFGLGGRSLEALPDVPAALSLRLRELQEDLNFTTRNTQLYVSTLVEMASVQRQASATTQGFAAALREQLASGELPRTQKNLQEVIGALRREMVELDTSTATGSRAYAENAAQVRVLERELNQLANSYRNVADMAVQAATAERSAATARVTALYMNNRAVRDQAQAMSELGNAVRSGIAGTPLMLPAAGQTTAPGTGLQISGGARAGGPSGNVQRVLTPGVFPGERSQGPEISPEQADRNRRAYISQIDAERQLREAREASESQLQGYRAEISKAAQANDGSINSIQRYRDSLVALRSTLPATGAEFKKLTSQVQGLDAQLERAQRSRRRMSAMEATQAAGAVISGGIFGGPEGAIGGAIGTAVGGVPGAFAGAAIGAQVGMIRQSLGQMAAFTAEIDKQRIALRNVVGTQAEYQSSLQFIDATSRRLAIPQDQLNKQFTQLSASVIGAGGNVDAAKIAFEGIAAGIRGTGGSLGDLDAALRATAQVFSKGKVSAEELRGQIGERLPGAFTLFAKSIDKTPQQLDKALQDGEVSLNDFIKFVQELSARYGESAVEIAASSQAAGDRIQTTFARLREAIGRELQPVGALLQNAFSDFITNAAPFFVLAAKGISSGITRMYDAISSGFNLLKEMGGLIQNLSKAMLVFGGISAGVFVASNIGTFIGALKNLYSVMRTLLSIQRILLAVESARAAMQAIIAGLTTGATKGKIIGAIVGGVGGLGAALGIGKLVEGIVKQVTESIDSSAKDFAAFKLPKFPDAALTDEGKGKQKTEDKERKNLFNELLNQLNSRNEILVKQGRLNESLAQSEMTRAVSANETAQQILQNEQAQLDLRLKYGEISATVYKQQQQAIKIEGQIVREEFTKTVSKLREEAQQLVDDVFGAGGMAGPTISPLQEIEDRLTKTIEEKRRRALQIGGTVGQEAAARLSTANINQLATKELLSGEFTALEQQIQDLKDAGRELSTLDILKRKYLADWNTLDPVLRNQLELLAAQVDALKNQQKAIEGLRNVAGAIGDAFGNSFKSVITGAATAKEALASFFSSVADSFADMAAKMIAEWIKLAILNTIVRIFNPAPGLSDLNAPASISNPLGVLNANGNAFAANGIVPYAKGGIVNRPTMFKFARGGTMQTGIMGEAGPEAIMPLKRGADGKLGVQAAGGSGITVNVSVDANGTQVQGDPGQGQQLGRVIAGAVQAELIKQQRPGGLLANSR